MVLRRRRKTPVSSATIASRSGLYSRVLISASSLNRVNAAFERFAVQLDAHLRQGVRERMPTGVLAQHHLALALADLAAGSTS